MAPVEGAISELVLPVSALLLDNHGALTAILIPVAMQAAVVSEVLRMGAAEFATVTVVAMHRSPPTRTSNDWALASVGPLQSRTRGEGRANLGELRHAWGFLSTLILKI